MMHGREKSDLVILSDSCDSTEVMSDLVIALRRK